MKIKTVVFDSDGTLFNSTELFIAAYAHIADVHQLPRPSAEHVRESLAAAKTLEQMLTEFFPGVPMDSLLEANSNYIQVNIVNTLGFEGLEELLNELHNTGYKLAVVTSGTEAALGMYKNHAIDHLFTSFVHSGRVTNHKPHPEGVQLALQECASLPEESVMVGDSRNDILAGKRAGCHATIGITHGSDSPENLRAAGADYIIDSLTALPEILKQLG